MLKVNEIYLGDCLELMLDIPDNSIDLICADLPYGKTKNKWDVVIPFGPLWAQYERIAKPNAAIILFGQDKFTANMMRYKSKLHRYNLIWVKTTPTGHFNANKMPLRVHEDIMVFYKKLPVYNPQKTDGHPRKVSTAAHKRNSKKSNNYGEHNLSSYDSTERHPCSVLQFATDKQKSALHETQKPVALIEFLIRSYTNEGAVVLDNTAGSGTTAIACINTLRDFICMEKDPDKFASAQQRIAEKYYELYGF